MLAPIFERNSNTKWAENLPIVQRIMNASAHAIAIALGRVMYLPISALNFSEKDLSEWASKRLQKHLLIPHKLIPFRKGPKMLLKVQLKHLPNMWEGVVNQARSYPTMERNTQMLSLKSY